MPPLLAPTRGKKTCTLVPSPAAHSMRTRPPARSTTRLTNARPTPVALHLGGEVRLEGPAAGLLVHADAAVADLQEHVVAGRAGAAGEAHGCDAEVHVAAVRQGLAGVDDEVEQQAGEVRLVDEHLADAGRPVVPQRVAVADGRPQDGQELGRHVREVQHHRRAGRGGELEQFVGQADAALGGGEQVPQLLAGNRGEVAAAGEQAAVALHDHQDVAEVVRQAGGHVLQGLGLLDRRLPALLRPQGGLQVRHFRRLDPQGELVGHRAGEVAVLRRPLPRRADVLVADDADQFAGDEDARVERRGDAERVHVRGGERGRPRVGGDDFGRDGFADVQRGEVDGEVRHPQRRPGGVVVLGQFEQVRAAEGGPVLDVQPDADALDAEGLGGEFARPLEDVGEVGLRRHFGQFEADRLHRPTGLGLLAGSGHGFTVADE